VVLTCCFIYDKGNEMNKIQKGMAEAVTGVVLGILLITIVNTFAQDGTIPKYFIWLFGLFSIMANLATLNALHYAGAL
jgi:hypothetical protein